MTYAVGLTGGIGSGKSTVAALFQEHGVSVIDSDIISHRLTRPGGAAMAEIRDAFGRDYIDPDGSLKRELLRQKVFSDPAARKQLEAILHPMIRSEMAAQIRIPDDSPYRLLVVPLLFETVSFLALVQRTLVVDCAEATQIARAIQRGLDEATVRAIMASQLPRDERLRRADDILPNDGDLDALRRQVAHFHRRYLTLSSAKH